MQIKAFTARAADMATRTVAMLDADQDGKVSAAELAARPGPEMIFDRIDADADGAVSQAEADAARQEMMEQGGRHRGGRQGGHDDGHAKRHGGDDDGEGWFDWGGWGDDSAKEN